MAEAQGGVNFEGIENSGIGVGGHVVGRDLNITQAAPDPTVQALHQLPAPPADFTGREAEMEALLADMADGATISGVQGMGGIGKTALALKLAERLRPRFPDAQLLVDLRGANPPSLTPAEAMAQVVRAFHPTAKLPEDERALAPLYRSVLDGQRALLLLDDAASRAQVLPLLPPAGCALLVTSRHSFALPGLRPLPLDTLPPADAEALLRRIAPRLGDAAARLAALCGWLPLALAVAASTLAERPDLLVADLVRRLAEPTKRLRHLSEVEKVFQVSYDLLDEAQQRRWRALAVFPAGFDRAAATAVWAMGDADEAADALSALVARSLVQWSAPAPDTRGGASLPLSQNWERGPGGEGGRYRLHDLARLFADARLSDAERVEVQRWHATFYKDLLSRADDVYLQGDVLGGLALFDRERRNIEAGQSWAAAHAVQDDAVAALCSDFPDAGVYVLLLRQHARNQIRWLEAALAAARRLKRRDAEGVHLGNLGIAYYSLGEVRRAIEFHQQRFAIARATGDRRGEGNALGNLGIAYYSLGEVRRAIEFYEQALVIDREIGDRRGEGDDLGNLGSAYYSLGEVRRAIEFYEQRLGDYTRDRRPTRRGDCTVEHGPGAG